MIAFLTPVQPQVCGSCSACGPGCTGAGTAADRVAVHPVIPGGDGWLFIAIARCSPMTGNCMLSALRLDHRCCLPGIGIDAFIVPADDDERDRRDAFI